MADYRENFRSPRCKKYIIIGGERCRTGEVIERQHIHSEMAENTEPQPQKKRQNTKLEEKPMKKASIIILALALVMGLSAPALAAEDEYSQTNLYFCYEAVDPYYFVTIPEELDLEFGGNPIPIIVDGTQDLGGKAVTITFEETQTLYMGAEFSPTGEAYYYTVLALGSTGNYVYYFMIDDDGNEIDQSAITGEPSAVIAGTVLMDFGGDGEKFLTLYVDINNKMWMTPNVIYNGYIVFGISLR